MKPKHLRLHIAFKGSSKGILLRVPAFSRKLKHASTTLVALGALLALAQIAISYTYEQRHTLMVESREQAYEELLAFRSQIDSMDRRIDRSFQDEELMYRKFGLPVADSSLRQMGTGGQIHPDTTFLWNLDPLRKLSGQVTGKMQQTGAKFKRRQDSYHELQKYMEQQYNSWQRIPSVAPANGRVSSGFGFRTHPVTGELQKMHQGLDISNVNWTPIYATATGIVTIARPSESLGNYVAINHGNGYLTRYGHMSKFIVKEGQLVERFQIIGYMGNTGRSTGSHVHYEVWKNNVPINPIAFILPDHSVE